MELTAIQQVVVSDHEVVVSTTNNNNKFIEANTQQVSLAHLKNDCIIPVFAKDNESTIPHFEFIDVVSETAQQLFNGGTIMEPNIRTSHIIKGHRRPGNDFQYQ